MPTAGGQLPSYPDTFTFAAGAAGPVDIEIGPDGNLYYADLIGGTIRRISYSSQNQPPVARVDATPTSGAAPLTVNFDATRSSDPENGALSYAWDLDADGQYDDSTAARPSHTFNQTGTYKVGLEVTDPEGGSGTANVTINVGNTPPTATITSPAQGFNWQANQQVGFAGSGSDAQDGSLPPSSMHWYLDLEHCPSNCHTHQIADWPGIASGSFSAPDHEYPSHLVLYLEVTDSGGLTDTTALRLDPRTVNLTFATASPSGLNVTLNGKTAKTPFTSTVIMGSANSISAPTPQTKGGRTYDFRRWSDGGARTHNVTASASKTYTATFRRR
jgi:PKD repeat protein